MTNTQSTAATNDPVCGMTVDKTAALHADRDGETFYFCSAHCKAKFLSAPAGTNTEIKSGGCCS